MKESIMAGVSLIRLVLAGGLLCGCSGISYNENEREISGLTEGGIDAQTGARAVMVMPVAVSPAEALANDDTATRLSREPVFLASIMRQIGRQVDANPALYKRVPMPAGKEADALMRKAVAAAGQLPSPKAFAETAGFALPECFIYGTIRLEALTIPRLIGKDERFYVATAMLRLVDRDQLTFVPFTAKAKGRDAATTIRAAVTKAAVIMTGG